MSGNTPIIIGGVVVVVVVGVVLFIVLTPPKPPPPPPKAPNIGDIAGGFVSGIVNSLFSGIRF